MAVKIVKLNKCYKVEMNLFISFAEDNFLVLDIGLSLNLFNVLFFMLGSVDLFYTVVFILFFINEFFFHRFTLFLLPCQTVLKFLILELG